MKIREGIESKLIKDVQYELDGMDIDGMVKRLVTKKEVKETVTRMVQEKIAQLIQDRAFMRIQKQMPILDAYVDEKVQGFLCSLVVRGNPK